MERMKELIVLLNKAACAYYQEDKEIMSDYEYDKLYDELLQLEKKTNIILANSPTQKVGYTILSNLKKIKHEVPILSLDKTKEIEKLKDFLKEQKKLEYSIMKFIGENNIDIFMLLITDIINSNSEAIVLGNKADIAEKAFSKKIENNRMFLPGVVSRKKQVFPVLMENA